MSITPGTLHHVELQALDLSAAIHSFGWLFSKLGYEEYQAWDDGQSWILSGTYVVVAQAPRGVAHDRRGAGLSHLAFHAGTTAEVDALWAAAPTFGWNHLYADRYPWAGGDGHYAAFVESVERFKVELVATPS